MFQKSLIEEFALKEITFDHVMAAYRIALVPISNLHAAFRFFAAMNLINAYVKQDDAESDFKKQYRFKEYVSKGIEQIIANKIEAVQVYVTKSVAYILFDEIQFSFHNITFTPTIYSFSTSERNRFQDWLGIRLQLIALDLYEYSKTLKIS